MDKKINTKNSNQKNNLQESQIRDTEGAVMPDANRKTQNQNQSEIESVFHQNKKQQR